MVGAWAGLITGLHAQTPPKKHNIEFHVPFYNFLDGTPTKWNYSLSRKAHALGFGIGYALTIHDKHSIQVFGTNFYADYHEKSQVPPGSIDARHIGQIQLDYRRRLFLKPRFFVDGLCGLVFRGGYEEIVLAYPRWFEVLTREHPLRDFGLQAGIRAEHKLLRHLALSLECSYTAFLIRYDHGQPPDGFDQGSTIHQLQMKVGLGFVFGRKGFVEDRGQVKGPGPFHFPACGRHGDRKPAHGCVYCGGARAYAGD